MTRIALLSVLTMSIPISACVTPDEPATDLDGSWISADPNASEGSYSEQEITSEGADGNASIVPSEDPSEDAARPLCVKVTHTTGTFTQTVYVTNNCRSTVSFVVHRVGPDSPCLHASPNTVRSYKWANGLNYQGITFGCD